MEYGDISLERIINKQQEKSHKLYSLTTLFRKRGPQEKWEYMEEGVPLLRRVLSWVDVLSCSTCMTIGAGIYVSAGIVANDYAGPAVVLSFLLAGISALISSLCYSEFAARIPVSGSTFSYVYISLGEFPGWMAGWISILEFSVSAAIAKGITDLCLKIVTILRDESQYSNSIHASFTNDIIATIMIMALAVLALIGGVKGSAMFCRIMSVVNVATIVFIVCSSFFFIDPKNWSDFFVKKLNGIVEGAARVFLAYVGFENSTTLTTEVKNPQKSMPFGVISSLCLATILYLSSSLVITGMVNYKELTTDTPFVDAFVGKNSWIAITVALGSLLCMTTTILSSLLGLPRVLYQMAKDGLLHESFAQLSRFRVPYLGTILIAIVSCLLTIFLDFSGLNDMICCGVLMNYTLINVGVIALRFMDSETPITRNHYLVLGATFLSCVLFGVSVDCPHAYVTALSLVPFVVCMVTMYYVIPVTQLVSPLPNMATFMCPAVPLLPCVGMLFNVTMIVQLEVKPLLLVGAWLLAGSVVYFAYGIRKSKLNFTNPNAQFYY